MAKQLPKMAEENVLEFLRCRNSFDYFCRNYIIIEVPGEDLKLTPYKPQTKLTNLLNKDHFAIVLKSRQIGISTITQAYVAWLTTFYKNVVVGIISKDGPEATKFSRTIMGMIDKLPKWMRPGFNKRTERVFILDNGCECYATPVAPNFPEKTLRGQAITFLVIDEAAFIKHIDVAWTSMVSTLSTNQKVARKNNVPYGTIILSTPNRTVGVGKWFYKKYVNANAGNGLFRPFTIHWQDVEELANDPDWYRQQCEMWDNDPRKIQQELELKFLGSEGSFFEESTIEVIQSSNVEPIEKIKIFNGEVWAFEKPIPDNFYIIGVDTAPEHGADKSAVVVWDYRDLRQVWEYQGKCPVQDFVKIVKLACATYPGLVVIESNSYGNQVVEEIHNSEYSMMMYKEKRGQQLYKGLATTAKTRPLMIDALYSYISQYPESVRSSRLALELVGLISKSSGRVEADVDCHDDLVFASAVCFYVRKFDPPLMMAPMKLQESSFMDIMTLNDIGPSDIGNPEVMKYVKENIGEMGGFVDIMSLYDRS